MVKDEIATLFQGVQHEYRRRIVSPRCINRDGLCA